MAAKKPITTVTQVRKPPSTSGGKPVTLSNERGKSGSIRQDGGKREVSQGSRESQPKGSGDKK